MSEKTYKISPWNLDALFTGIKSEDVSQTLQRVEENTGKFETYREKLSPEMDIEDFYEAITLSEKIYLDVAKLSQYAFLKFSSNTQDTEAMTFMGKMDQINAEVQNRLLFFSLWWKGLEDDEAQKFMVRAGEYEYYLKQLRNFKPYTLGEEEEKIINLKNVTGSSAIKSVYEAITNRLTFKLTIDGEEKELTQSELLQNVYSTDADLRAAAYQELFRVYGNEGPVLGLLYQNYARDYVNENVKIRGMETPISHRNLVNDVPDDVVEALLDVAKQNTHIFHRFFGLKAKWLKLEKLRRYDIYAPVADDAQKTYAFNDAAHMVLEAFKEFDPKIATLAQRVLDESHIDSEVRKGKMGGAYNYGVDPAMTPFVLMNYIGKPRDAATLAHELGHSIHGMMASHHNLFNAHAPLPLAETASTFGEMLLTDKLLAEEKDAGVKRDILFAQMDDAFATILRQCFFAIFEKDAHQAINEGASVDDICEIYSKNLQEQFGDSVELYDEFKWEWVYVAHFYDRPFYVYAYAFGQLLVFALYQQFKQEGRSFIPRFMTILSDGGSMSPIDILDKAGVDIRTAEFWQGGFDVISEMVDQLEQIPVG
ncbi:MAG TPA: M3 family oligoendopeptidase [Anaerolineales bacterium]|nr:M3 family oligoendopeptidase [Anaerolineales bacterium]